MEQNAFYFLFQPAGLWFYSKSSTSHCNNNNSRRKEKKKWKENFFTFVLNSCIFFKKFKWYTLSYIRVPYIEVRNNKVQSMWNRTKRLANKNLGKEKHKLKWFNLTIVNQIQLFFSGQFKMGKNKFNISFYDRKWTVQWFRLWSAAIYIYAFEKIRTVLKFRSELSTFFIDSLGGQGEVFSRKKIVLKSFQLFLHRFLLQVKTSPWRIKNWRKALSISSTASILILS